VILLVPLMLTLLISTSHKVFENFDQQQQDPSGSSQPLGAELPSDDDELQGAPIESEGPTQPQPVQQQAQPSTQPPPPPQQPTTTQPADNPSTSSSSSSSSLDYASTIEEAYGNLNGFIGSEGIKNLTNQTNSLLQQQNTLVDTMKTLQPLMANAKSLMDSFKSMDPRNA
jgi:hypothetical protein